MKSTHEETVKYLKTCYLFDGLSHKQFQQLSEGVYEIFVNKGEMIIQENAQPDNIFIIKEGSVEIHKLDNETKLSHRLGFLGRNEVIGDMAFFDDAARSASVIAAESTALLVIPMSHLAQLKKQNAFLGKIISENPILLIAKNAAKNMSRRIRASNATVVLGLKKELAQAQLHNAMSSLIIMTLVMFSLYVFVVQAMDQVRSFVSLTTLLSVPLLIVFMFPVIYLIKHSSYPLSTYGLTLQKWRSHALEAIILTVPVLILIFIGKWIALMTLPGLTQYHLFDFTDSTNRLGGYAHFSLGWWFLSVVLYAMFIPIQEFFARGVLQGSFERMLVGRYQLLWSIVLANLIFSASHVFISIWLGLAVFLPGLFWGWLYSKQESIVGVSVSHFIVGIWAVYIVGIG